MTRKDYIMIAACIREELSWNTSDSARRTLHSLMVKIAGACLADTENPRFNINKFVKACGF